MTIATAYSDENKAIIKQIYAEKIIKLYNMIPCKNKYLTNYYDKKRKCYPIEKINIFNNEYNWFIDKNWILKELVANDGPDLIDCVRDNSDLSGIYVAYKQHKERNRIDFMNSIDKWTLAKETKNELLESSETE